ncbi:unnamed protein product [Clonostachys chloroleuca]|uniref:Tc1-like transposase DDE domain-containing protein n=1 Tax=Clonostachys chloroleuca TaxID=1926264 RepID=A0AA35MFI8_9HYPO|nr:unnamed protein product [Clonostachys chloroleuca]CAI6090700.1 unnamed protein product [Clonostachys chloroleuca]CAI6095859.1 unnamed protein product [Clonostachys chloroleuca]
MPGKQHNTPKKARIRGAYEFLRAKGLSFHKTELFDFFHISQRSGNRILAAGSSRRRHNNPDLQETRGRPSKLSEGDLDKLERLYDEEGFEAKALPWTAAAIEAGIETEITDQTIRSRAASRGLYKRLAAEVAFTTAYNVIFSDECHFGYGDEGRYYIARKRGTRSDPLNIQERLQPEEGDKKRLHGWAGIGYEFKSPLKDILESYVKRWIEEGRSFVLEEDGDSGHGPGKSNPVRTWKEEYSLESFFNCPRSPDLPPIENCWLVPKAYIRKYPHWDLDTLHDLVEEGWEQLSQSTINRWVESMPQRLRDVIKMEGKMTNW